MAIAGQWHSDAAMRPDILNPLFAEVETLGGVGPKLRKPLDRLGLTRVRDVLYHLPDRFVSRRAIANLDEGSVGEQVVVKLTVRANIAPGPASGRRCGSWRRMRRAIIWR